MLLVPIISKSGISALRSFANQLLNSIAMSESTPLELMDLLGSISSMEMDNNLDSLCRMLSDTTVAAVSIVVAELKRT